MSCSAIMAVVYILGVSPADGTAVCFGTEESGAFAPAAFEERRHSPGTTDALRGVKTLVFAQEVLEVGRPISKRSASRDASRRSVRARLQMRRG